MGVGVLVSCMAEVAWPLILSRIHFEAEYGSYSEWSHLEPTFGPREVSCRIPFLFWGRGGSD